jgi:HSP20 family molecular chaperone IbpA
MVTQAALEKQEGTVAAPERTHSGPTFRPNVDIVEREDELLLIADVPGANEDNINIDFERGQLSISAKVTPRQKEEMAYLLREYGVGEFSRSFQVGEAIDGSKIDAYLKNGVLTVHLPKTEAVKARKIAVKTT